jgi:hypothetical protein
MAAAQTEAQTAAQKEREPWRALRHYRINIKCHITSVELQYLANC